METRETVLPITPGQVKELASALVRAVPLDMSFETAQAWIGRQGLLQDILRRGPGLVFSTHSVAVSLLLEGWQSFYKKFFGLDTDFSSVRIPERKPGFDRLLIIAQGLTPNQIIQAYQRMSIKVWLHIEDLDSALDWDKEERNPKNGSYAIWVRNRQEADEELKNLSANQITEKGLTTETLTERLIHGLVYHSETNHHLDEANVTLCSGSRSQDSDVPSVFWYGYDSEVFVRWFLPVGSGVYLRSRQVVRP